MTLDQLLTFLAVARLGSFTRAAEEIGRTQPAVSQQIRQLEESLGAKLFEKLGKRVYLTEAGRMLKEGAEELRAQASRLREAVSQVAKGERGRVRIGASTTPGIYLLPRILGAFRRRYPAVETSLSIENTFAIERKIKLNELDLGFVGAHPAKQELVVLPLGNDELVPVAAPSYLGGRRRRLEAEELAEHPFVARERGSGTRQAIDAWASRKGVSLNVVMELNNPEAVKMAVAEGLGVSILPRCAVAPELRQRRLVPLPIKNCRIVRHLSVIYHQGKHLAPAASALVDLSRKLIS